MLAHRPTRADIFKPGRWEHLARSKQLHAMGNHTKNGIRAHNVRHTIDNDPGDLHAMSNHTQNDTQDAHADRHAITRRAWAYSC